MGGFQSRCNDSMIDELVKRNRITARNIERAFRLVDRGTFLVTGSERRTAYSDLPVGVQSTAGGPFHPGHLHLSASDVYASALKNLDVRKGQTFLNIGSGTGYLSTIVGILLGENGVNHGIELYQNLIDYAEQRIDEWITTPGANSVDWARPIFKMCDVHCEQFLESHAGMYDRIYIGFALENIRVKRRVIRMLKIGGILVAPSEERLCRYVRISNDGCHRQNLSLMNFARGIQNPPGETEPIACPPAFEKIPPLSHLTRQVIRREVRKASFTRERVQWTSRTLLVEKSCTRRLDRLPHQDYPRWENDLFPLLPREFYAPNAEDVARWHQAAPDWMNVETVHAPVSEPSPSSSIMSQPRSPVVVSGLSTPDSDDWGPVEERGEAAVNREINDVASHMEFFARFLTPMVPEPPNHRLDEENERTVDPLSINFTTDSTLIPDSTPSNRNITDDDLSGDDFEEDQDEEEEEEDEEDDEEEEEGMKDAYRIRKWLAGETGTGVDPNVANHLLRGPSTPRGPSASSSMKGNISEKGEDEEEARVEFPFRMWMNGTDGEPNAANRLLRGPSTSAVLSASSSMKGNISDKGEEGDDEDEEEEKEEKKGKYEYRIRKWLESDPESGRPTVSGLNSCGPSTSAGPSTSSYSQQASTSQKRSIPLDKDHHPKRIRTERRGKREKKSFVTEREEREAKCMRLRPRRDEAIAEGYVAFQERVKKLPIPYNLKNFVQKMKHEVMLK